MVASAAEVPVAERPCRAPRDARQHVARDVRAHLLGGGRDTGHRLAVLLQAGEIAGDEHFRMAGQRQVRLHAHASGAIELGAPRITDKLLAKRRGRDARGPQDGARRDALSPKP